MFFKLFFFSHLWWRNMLKCPKRWFWHINSVQSTHFFGQNTQHFLLLFIRPSGFGLPALQQIKWLINSQFFWKVNLSQPINTSRLVFFSWITFILTFTFFLHTMTIKFSISILIAFCFDDVSILRLVQLTESRWLKID